jgi:hypothetical protein
MLVTQTMFEFLPTYLSDALIGLALFSALTYIIPFVLAAFVWKEQNLKVTVLQPCSYRVRILYRQSSNSVTIA